MGPARTGHQVSYQSKCICGLNAVAWFKIRTNDALVVLNGPFILSKLALVCPPTACAMRGLLAVLGAGPPFPLSASGHMVESTSRHGCPWPPHTGSAGAAGWAVWGGGGGWAGCPYPHQALLDLKHSHSPFIQQ